MPVLWILAKGGLGRAFLCLSVCLCVVRVAQPQPKTGSLCQDRRPRPGGASARAQPGRPGGASASARRLPRPAAQDGAFNQLAGRSLSERKAGPRLAEAGGRPELDLALSGRPGGQIGRSLWAAL